MKLWKLVIILLATVSSFASAQTHDTRSVASGGVSTSSTSSACVTTGVEAGSHEDWCAEHEVPESQCTRCDPDLIPAFQASGDWCAEHGLPESHCRVCNPQLQLERPTGGK